MLALILTAVGVSFFSDAIAGGMILATGVAVAGTVTTEAIEAEAYYGGGGISYVMIGRRK